MTSLNESRFWASTSILESGERNEVSQDGTQAIYLEQIIAMLREAEVGLSQGEKVKGD